MSERNEVEVQFKKTASRILQEILDAHQSKDYSKMVSLLSDSAKQAFSERTFHETIENQLQHLGTATESTYLGSLRKSGGTLTVWKVLYEKNAQEILWQLLLTNSGNTKVAGLFFS